MASRSPFEIKLSSKERASLEAIARTYTNSHRDVLRAKIVLYAAEGGVQATNWRAEQALRPAVVARKHWGGNASWQGAHTFEVLASLLRTCRQQGADALAVIAQLLQSPHPGVAPVMPEHATLAAQVA